MKSRNVWVEQGYLVLWAEGPQPPATAWWPVLPRASGLSARVGGPGIRHRRVRPEVRVGEAESKCAEETASRSQGCVKTGLPGSLGVWESPLQSVAPQSHFVSSLLQNR